MWRKKWFQVLVGLILFFLLVYLMKLSSFIFQPLLSYLAVIALPLTGAGILYYITRPVINYLFRQGLHQLLVILIDFLLIAGVLALIFTFLAPVIQGQIGKLINNAPEFIETARNWIQAWQQNQTMLPPQVEESVKNAVKNLEQYTKGIVTFLFGFASQLVGFIFSFILIPVFLFFMIKDREKFIPTVTRFLSPQKANSYRDLMNKINHTLGSFVFGQFVVSVCVGVMLYIGYLIIGLKFALSLAFFGFLMNVIPFLGPFLAAAPAVIVAFFQSPMMAVWTIVVLIVASQIDANLITPNVIGNALDVHPLIIITIVLAASSIAGILGMIFAVPAYAVAKTIVSHFYHEWRKKQPVGDKEIL